MEQDYLNAPFMHVRFPPATNRAARHPNWIAIRDSLGLSPQDA
jgi:hypothetical protein